MKLLVVSLALMVLPTWTAAEPFTGKLAQLPPIVKEHIRDMEGGCKPDYRLSDVVHVHSLSGARTRDYIIDESKFGCRSETNPYCNVAGSCGFAVYLQRGQAWKLAWKYDLVVGWYTIRRPGKKSVLVIQRRCYGGACRRPHSFVLRITRDEVTEKEIR